MLYASARYVNHEGGTGDLQRLSEQYRRPTAFDREYASRRLCLS